MAEQERKTRTTKEDTPQEDTKANPQVVKKGKKLIEEIDKVLDDIDEVLEENAEEFVKSYVQRGGE